MILPVHGFQAEIRAFIEHGLWSGQGSLGPASFMGWATEAEGLIAGVAFHGYQPVEGVIELSAYSTRRDWCSRQIVREMFAYAFDGLGCRIACARCSAKNTRARRIWRAFGASEVILPRMRADDEDEAVSILHRDDWRQSKFMR